MTNGILHRPEDKMIVKEVRATYSDVPVRKGDIVLDIGANIGASARLFLDKGAAKVIGVEPDPVTLTIAKKNLQRRRASLIWAAVGAHTGRTTIWVSPKPYLTSTIEDKGRIPVKVPQVTLGGLLGHYHPSVVKVDVEFGEYDMAELTALPDYVRVLAMEVHVRYDQVFEHRKQTDEELGVQRQRAADLIAAIEAQGFREIRRKDKKAKAGPITDDTGLHPLTKSVDAIWAR